MKQLTLYELNNLVRSILELSMPKAYWLVAELSEVRTQKNGHCYLEFVQKNPDGNALLARARGCIWRDTYMLLAPHFEQTTGMPLTAGMTVLVNVEVKFHELYGYSLVVTDIDPSYTMGNLARKRKEIMDHLITDGVAELNKRLHLPRPLLRIAVISSPTAAGYGDFRRQLEQSDYPFIVKLFPAIMQGIHVEESVIAALDVIAEEADKWDAVIVIRGGGAVSDLSGFDTELLATNVAQFPLPILTGIGHERDDTVIDLVAHTRFKTPTAVAAFLVERQKNELDELAAFTRRLNIAIKNIPANAYQDLERLSTRLQNATTTVSHRESIRLNNYLARFNLATKHQLDREASQLLLISSNLQHAIGNFLNSKRHPLNLIDEKLSMLHPERLLRVGFSITTCKGRIIRHTADIEPGEHITTLLSDGELESKIEKTTSNSL